MHAELAFVLAFVALVAHGAFGMDTEDAELDEMENEKLAVNGAGTPHQFGCSDEGKWKGSCDIAKNYSLVQAADWTNECDPWRVFVHANDSTNGNVTFSNGAWTCPEKYRSVSGCGDFRTDPRKKTCAKPVHLKFDCSERIVVTAPEPLLPQKHVCTQRPIFYENVNTAGKVTPPIVGRHRLFWAKWGEYEYIPPQRWLHNSEHGAAIFLYHPCLDEESKCKLRRYIQKWQAKMQANPTKGGSSKMSGEFRFIMTPFSNLQTGLAVSMWGELFMTKCFDELELDAFITRNYRNAWEDYSTSGKYSHLHVDIDEMATHCAPALDDSSAVGVAIAHPTGVLRPVGTQEFDALKDELASLRTLVYVSATCVLVLLLALGGGGALLVRRSSFKASQTTESELGRLAAGC